MTHEVYSMTTETGLFRRTGLIILSSLVTIVGLVGGGLEATVWYLKYQEQLKKQHQEEITQSAQQLLALQFQQSQETKRHTEEERQAEAQRLIDYGAQQALLQMQAQQQADQRRAVEERQAEAQRLINYGAQQALLQMQAQQQSDQRRAEEERQVESQRLVEQGAQQELLKKQAQQQQETQQILERKTQVLETVESYFELVNRHQITQVMRILANPTDKTRKVLENNEWVRLDDIALISADNDQAVVNVRFQGKSKDISAREYAGNIPMKWIDNQWKIVTLTQLTNITGNKKPQETTDLEEIEDDASEAESASNTASNLIPDINQLLNYNKTGSYASIESDWGNGITARFRKTDCPIPEFKDEGYMYLFFEDIPEARAHGTKDTYNVKDGKAITVLGCWLQKDNNAVHLKTKRKKDKKVLEWDIPINEEKWKLVIRDINQ
jgi:hypothetical protein